MARPMLVALWGRSNAVKHLERENGARITLLQQALVAVRKQAQALLLPDRPSPKALFVVPEYYITQVHGGEWEGTAQKGGFVPRSISEEEKERVLQQFLKLSRQFPEILIIPGTVAWKKPLDRSPQASISKKRHKLKKVSRRAKARRSLKRFQDKTSVPMFLPSRVNPHLKAVLKERYTDEEDRENKRGNTSLMAKIAKEEKLAPNSFYAAPMYSEKVDLLSEDSDSDSDLEDEVAEYMMRNTAYVLLAGKVALKYNKQGDFHEAIGEKRTVFIPGVRAGWATIRDIHLGLEVCFDHNLATLQKDLPPKIQPDIHVVTSDSVDNDENSFCVRENGYFIHASTDSTGTCVKQRTSGGFVDVSPLSQPDPKASQSIYTLPPIPITAQVGGEKIQFWTIDLE